MKKLLVGLFVFGFLLVGSHVNAEVSTPTLTVLFPNNGGESVEVGGKIEIRWMSPNISLASIEVYISDGTHKGHTESVRMENNVGSVIYTLDSNLIPGSNYKAYVSTAYGSAVSVSDSSDYPFTIKAIIPVSTPSITVLSPNGGETYTAGQQITVNWESRNVVANIVGIILYDVNNSIKLDIYPTANDGTETITLPNISGNNFRIFISNDQTGGAYSDSFTINSVTPSITVLTPNGRDMYEVGQQINVTWNSTGILASSNNIDITLHGYNANGVIVWSKELSSFTFNDGQEKVILPTNLGGVPFGKNFVISVGTDSTNNPSPISDFSDTTFTIGKTTDVTNGGCSNGEIYSSTSGQVCPTTTNTNPVITIFNPSVGSTYTAGQTIPISWTKGVPGLTYITFYKSDSSYSTAARVTNNPDTSGNMTYTFPSNMPTGKYKVYAFNEVTVNGVINSTNLYESNGYFNIVSYVTDNGCSYGASYSYTTGQRCSIINVPICPANMPNPLALCSDGRIEAATKDSNNCTTSYRCIIPQNDLGCKNHEIYSTVTRQLCPIVITDSGCTSTSKYSSTTGQACLGKVPEVDGGCNGINKYSLMTGKLCSNFTGVYTPVIPNTIDIPITRTLKLGIKGDDVKALQAFLNLLADGSFGPKTQAKVMEWQAANGLTADGSFGRMSREKAGLTQ